MATSIVNIPVPFSGDGPIVNVSSLVGEKTVSVTGSFKGQYVLLGSHNKVNFIPLLAFDAGGGDGIKLTTCGAIAWVRLRSLAMDSSNVRAMISGLAIPGNNSFGMFPVLGPGASGPQPSIDLGLSDFQEGLNFISNGGLAGSVVVEGSLDNRSFTPIGSFSAEPISASLLAASPLELAPVSTSDRIRYVRLDVQGVILTPFMVTIGGSQTAGGGAGAETLHDAYEVGVSSVDQTLSLGNAQGGKVIFDASDPGFTDLEAVQVMGPRGEGAAFLRDGGMVLGPDSNIVIGVPGQVPTLQVGTTYSVAIGTYNVLVGGTGVALGINMSAIGYMAVALGSNCLAENDETVAVGVNCESDGVGSSTFGFGAWAKGTASLAFGNNCLASGDRDIAIGPGAFINTFGASNLAIGDSADASGQWATSVGCGSVARGFCSIAVGFAADASVGNYQVAIGVYASAEDDSVAMGDTAVAGGTNDVAIGDHLSCAGNYSVAIGAGTSVEGDYCVAVGVSVCQVGVVESVALGYIATANASDSVALGPYASAGTYSLISPDLNCVAVGNYSTAYGSSTVAVGDHAFTSGGYNVAVGYYARAVGAAGYEGVRNVVMGYEAQVGYQGSATSPTYDDNVVIGSSTSSYGIGSVVIGTGAAVGQQAMSAVPLVDAVAIGDGSSVQSNLAIAVGSFAAVTGNYSIAVGPSAGADGESGVALGDTSNSGVGAGNTCLGCVAQVQGMGDFNVCLGNYAQVWNDSSAVVVIGNAAYATGIDSSSSVVIGANAHVDGVAGTAVGAGTTVSSDGWGVAVGLGAQATALSAIAIGTDASAGANETVFDMTFGHVQTFRTVSNEPGVLPGSVLDLFQFSQTNLGAVSDANKTDMALLIRGSDNTITLKSVFLSAPVGGVSMLQVVNP